MRILHVVSSLDRVTGGGMAARTLSLCTALTEIGVETAVLTLDIGLDDGIRSTLLPARLERLRCLNRRFYVPEWAPGRIRSAVTSADVVHVMGHWAVLGARAVSAADRSGTPYVLCPAGGLPVFGRSVAIKRAYNFAVGAKIVRRADGYIAITERERSDFEPYGVAPAAVSVIPNGVDLAETPSGRALAELHARLGDDSTPYVLFMGRLNPIKGPDLLLAAAAAVAEQFKGLRIVLAGPDEGMGAALRARAERSGIADRVVFLGAVHGQLKAAAYRCAQLVVVPSRQEAMSLVALEAGASGTPVLLTDVCGFPQVEQVDGGCVVSATADGLADGLRTLLSKPTQLQDMGRRLQQLVLVEYTWDRAARSYLDLYHRLLGTSVGR